MNHFYRTAALAAAILFGPAASAATITVTTLDDERAVDGDCSLREAVEAANTNTAVDLCAAGEDGDDGDVITFLPTLAGGTITLTQQGMDISEDLEIDGSTVASNLAIDGADQYRIFRVTGGTLSLNNITVQNGRAASGAGVYVNENVGFAAGQVLFLGHTATGGDATNGGAAVYNDGGTTSLMNCLFEDNDATGTSGSGGAVLNNGGDLTVTGSLFRDNSAMRAGGAIEVTGEATTDIEDTDFETNSAGPNPGNGGAIHVSGPSSSSITGGTVSGNFATAEGGGFWNNVGTMTVTSTMFINNEGAGPDADNGGGALYNNGGTMLVNDATLTDNSAVGASGSGGGILSNGGTLTVTGGTFTNNRANRAGGGVESAGASTTLDGVTMTDNSIPAATAAPGNGGAVHAGGGTLTVLTGIYTGNEATEGGAIWANGVLDVSGGTTIQNNTGRGAMASNGGGGIYVETGGMATIADAQIQDNTASGASGSGGGVLVASGATATVTGGVISENRANRAGAGIEVAGGTLDLVDVTVSDNEIPAGTAAPGNGGGLHAGGGVVRVRGGVFSGNEATEGGGLWSNGRLTIGDQDSLDVVTTISGNVGRGDDASNGGGGVYAESGADMRIFNAQILDNLASGTAGSGGGILIADGSTLVIEGGMVSGNMANRAGAGIEIADDGMTDATTNVVMDWVMVDGNVIKTAAPGNGGGIHIGGAGEAIVRGSTISNNTAREGAGVWVAGSGRFDIANSTVSGNAADEDGGGLYDNGGASSARYMLESVTVAMNTAGGMGGGLLSESDDGSTFTFANTILAYNEADSGDDCSGAFVSGDYNLIETTDGCTINGMTDNNIVGEDPLLGPLADNGGRTLTHLPAIESPVVDNGFSMFDVDQRDVPRNTGRDDIGAVEAGRMPVAGEGDPSAVTELTMYGARPNPARGRAQIAFAVAETANARVEVYNVLGQRVMTAFDGTATAGREQLVDLDVSALAPGVYHVRVLSGADQSTRQITVVR